MRSNKDTTPTGSTVFAKYTISIRQDLFVINRFWQSSFSNNNNRKWITVDKRLKLESLFTMLWELNRQTLRPWYSQSLFVWPLPWDQGVGTEVARNVDWPLGWFLNSLWLATWGTWDLKVKHELDRLAGDVGKLLDELLDWLDWLQG